MKKLILFLALGAAGSIHAQITNAPLTYFEAGNAATDATLIKGISSIGTLSSQIDYPVEIRVERVVNLQSSNTVYAVALRTRVSRQMQVDYIDYDELDGLIRCLQLISQANHSVTPMDDFEVAYRTRCGLSVIKVSNGNKITLALKSSISIVPRNTMQPFVLDDLAKFLTDAKARIDAISASGQ